MTLTQFIADNTKDKVSTDILQRWNERVLPQNLHTKGIVGADDYLARYGKGISVNKIIKIANCARVQGFPAMELTSGLQPIVPAAIASTAPNWPR